MQPVPNTPFAPPYVPALGLRGEKPHQGVRNKNPAPYRGHNRCNFRTALGLRKGQCQNRVRSRCSGEQYDSDLGLYYLRARYYNPATGRFLSRDPLNGNAFDPKTLHKYLYAGGDPVNATDPTGKGIVETVWNWAKSVAATVVEASWVKHFVASCLIATAIVTAYVYHHPNANVAWPEVVIWGGLGCNLVWVYGT